MMPIYQIDWLEVYGARFNQAIRMGRGLALYYSRVSAWFRAAYLF